VSSPALSADTAIRQSPGILFRDLAGEAVLLDAEAGIYFGLNEVGTRAWTLFGAGGSTLGAVHTALLAEYAAPAEQIWDDLLALVRDLLAHGLAEIVGTTFAGTSLAET
jgi:Coenzyme PQQ synthesis protein D (PqqD)